MTSYSNGRPLNLLQAGQQSVVVQRVIEDGDDALLSGHGVSHVQPAHGERSESWPMMKRKLSAASMAAKMSARHSAESGILRQSIQVSGFSF